jgi:uncharacterized membrane protein SpoIIM required for sporulation
MPPSHPSFHSFDFPFRGPEADRQRLEALLARSGNGPGGLSPAEIREMALLYRSLVHDLSRLRGRPEAQPLEPYLNNLAQRGHGRIHAAPPTSWRNVARFFTERFPQCFRRNARWIGLAALLFALGSVAAMLTIQLDPATEPYFLPPGTIENLDRGVLWTDSTGPRPSESSFLMTNNIRVAVNAFALGVFFGAGTLTLLFHNGLFAFGGPLQVCFRHGMGGRLLAFIAPHGVIELTTIFIAGGAGMLIGFTALFPGRRSRREAVREKASEALVLMMGCLPLLVVAGLIEGMISLNREIGPAARFGISALSALGLGAYLGFCGRGSSFEDGNARSSSTATSGRVLNRKRGNGMRRFFR